jgi:class 3 adenylate cyclase
VTFGTEDSYLDDDVLYAYNSQLAMGMALLRSRYLDSDVYQFALWDGCASMGDAGTAADVDTWRRAGHRSIVVSPSSAIAGDRSGASHRMPTSPMSDSPGVRRVVRSMLMGDIRGYSKLNDKQLLTFSSLLLDTFSDVLSRYDSSIEYRNTWGDALFVVLSDPVVAARCGLDLQDALSALKLREADLPDHLALRLSGHVGPVFPMVDPVLHQSSFFGSHITRAARMEPVATPGALVVTEAFAAALELSDCSDLGCNYVGHRPTAKDYGRLRMYVLERTSTSDRRG